MAGVLCLGIGCAAGRVVNGTYQDSERGYQVRLPVAPWLPRPMDGATLSFESPELRAAMALLVDCRAPEVGELPWVARHLFFGLREKQIQAQEFFRRHDADGVRTRLQARLDGATVEVEGITYRRAGCLYDFIYVAPPTNFPLGRPDFEAFVESWAPLAAR